MAKFMLIYRDQAGERPAVSPEEMQGFLQMWDVWMKQFGDRISDTGDELLPTGRVLKGDGTVANGPYVEAKEIIGGYSVVQAEHYEAAIEIARECPIAKIGGNIEIRELAGHAV
jgi:hypothetical protein